MEKISPIHRNRSVREKVLVIDDELIVRQSIVTYLQEIGFGVVDAESGQQGLELFAQEKPDLVLCDLRNPEIDALTVLRKITQQEPGIPVIIVSATSSPADVVQALRLGAADYLIRPIIDLEVLKHSIERNIERARLLKENKRYRKKLEKTNEELQASLDKLREDMQIGRRVQLNMLPSPIMTVGDYTFQHRIIPSLYLSGDFVDYFRIDDDRLIFYIADVSGHGASSAFVTVLLKNFSHLLHHNYQQNKDIDILYPAKILELMNQELLDTGLERHISVFLGVLDCKRQQLRYSMAGQFPRPIIKTSKYINYLVADGLPVGLVDDAKYQDKILDISENFSLFMFSDGVLEILPNETLVEKEAYLLDLITHAGNNVQELESALNLESFVEFPDDITLLLLSRH